MGPENRDIREELLSGTKRSWPCWMPTAVILIGISSVVLLLWANRINEGQLQNHFIMDVIMDVQLHVSTAHLWLEEAVSGDNTAEEARADLDEAIHLIDLFINGGKYEFGRVLGSLDDAVVRLHAEEIKSLLVKFKLLAGERMGDIERAGIGSASDQQFDAVFTTILRKSRALEGIIESKNVESRANSGRLLLTILLAWPLIVSATTAILWRLEARRKKAEEELLKANEQLVATREELVLSEKLAMLGLIAGNMGNELLNPLGVMNNAVYYLKSKMPDGDETVREYLDIIKSEIDTSKGILSALLDYSTGQVPQAGLITAHELVRQSLGRGNVPGNVLLEVDVPEPLPKMKVDPLQIEQVLRNLITNAVQAMPDGGTLRIAARRRVVGSRSLVLGFNQEPGIMNQEPDADFIEISVTDTGVGIAPENMGKLFQPLFTTKSRGIGLGLVLSKKLTEANGGRIEAQSRPGEGTNFSVILPAGKEALS